MQGVSEARLTRRNFLKTGAAVAGGVWAGAALGCAPSEKEDAADSTEQTDAGAADSEDEIVVNCCRPNCFASCMLNVHVREGKVVKTSPADYPNTEFNRCCLRGLSHVENIYHPDRVLYPLRRVEGTERGAGEWERVTWDEALDDIAAKLKEYREEFGDASITHSSCSSMYHVTCNAVPKFFGEINASSTTPCVDMGNYVGIMRVFGNAGLWPGNDFRDYVNSKNIFLWGNNLTDAQLQDWHFMADAIEAGANIICIDPTFTQMAAKSHKWVPIRPASDLWLTMAMMNVIIEENLVDWDFMRDYTVAPFLVKEEDGKFLRMSDLGVKPTEGDVDPATGEPTVIDPYAVWDADANEATELGKIDSPALEGSFEADGIKVSTAYTLLKNEVDKFTPEVASKECDVPVETIIELAHLACDGPVYHRVGYGAQAYDNGIHPYHAGCTLAALTGQLGEPGASYSPPGWWMFEVGNANPEAVAARTTYDKPSPAFANMIWADVIEQGEYMGQPFTPKALWVYCGNPLNTWVDTNVLRDDVFAKYELVVTVDTMITDSAKYSDYVLPLAHWFEYEDAVVRGSSHHVTFAEKAVDPLGESLCDLDIMRMLADKMGFPADFFQGSNEEMLRVYFDTEGWASLGIDYDTLKEQHSIRALPDPYLMWQDKKFLTPSQRVEFYVEDPQPNGYNLEEPDLSREHLPTWFEPHEAWPGTELAEQFPFVLMSERPRYRVHGQWAYNRMLREIDPEPTVKMNPLDAEELGLEDGIHVECYNDHGHAVAKLVYNAAIRPGTLVYPKSWECDQHLAGSWSEPLSRKCDPVLVNQSFMDCRVAVRAWEE